MFGPTGHDCLAVVDGAKAARVGEAVMSLAQFIPILFWTILLFVPLFALLRKTGQSFWWLLLLLLPILGGIILLWIIAFARWPNAIPGKA